MIDAFHLTAVCKHQKEFTLHSIPLHQELQADLSASWQDQLSAFHDDIEEIPFNAGYKPEPNERFAIANFALPAPLAGIESGQAGRQPSIGTDHGILTRIAAIAAFVRIQGRELILFQNFSRSHVVQPGRFLFQRNDSYQSAKDPAITLGDRLCATYDVASKQLLFHNFRSVNTFLPLSDYYGEASEEQIRHILAHKCIKADDPNALAIGANQWLRKRFAMLKDSGVLDDYSPKQIRKTGKDYGIDVTLTKKKGKIVFPTDDRPAAKKLLQFLNEEIYRGAITDKLYETNSKREAEKI
jgi:hypothetical protein